MNIGMIFAGGIGKRMNNSGIPKQFLKLYNKEIIIYTLEIFENSDLIDGIVISCLEEKIEYLKEIILKNNLKKIKSIVPGGKTGQESIYNGLKEISKYYSNKDIVLIHDGVRPLINLSTIENNIQSVKKNGNAITVAEAIETIIQADKDTGVINSIYNRNKMCVARAPQSFYLEDILKCHEKSIYENKLDFIDSASMMNYYGYKLNIVFGPAENIKITTPSDFYTFKAIQDMKENLNIFGI
ncbi:IspD/TarI family cytidylyltransferase [Fusobacterium necrophorum]|uniref:2-C-methyl-D-erythritol 4-phosphate cytidylyltransferase n=2 Tax=Fusobacterium necrophorum TaxID=859 RepID=A0AB73C051_9FUSO|nr:IspD/TarI family cytidylyltransferase [Fusobacterium necrophorum]KDE61603.1 2-C-methyl-D-erythritol 4-phosphate cytidylyltransferase [Fusobacterium necrophorum DJ-1]KDE67193.1 2-C-methyl-D-erythritol 4-phosphate cytidylyltransferase [Fusobacterium necrophorum BFTR-1]KDE69327.1 2-C-methyl-D-erythritol 4-phosphate cytidylyltransferase [Fusobacterium necrophorum DJ-2]MBR8823441.1 Ribitol-5-phosphate cytidylyltransferase [Fusobacterium necrophorum]MCF0163583.1 2-C-methyl-D-erythritol 4-phosphat